MSERAAFIVRMIFVVTKTQKHHIVCSEGVSIPADNINNIFFNTESARKGHVNRWWLLGGAARFQDS
jgi:hypothetical protein